MPYADTLKIFDVLRENFDEKQAKTIARAIEDAIETNNGVIVERVATKNDIAALKNDILNMKAEIIKWMFLFWIGQAAFVFGVISYLK